MLTSILVMVSSKGCITTGWMCITHLEGMIFIHLKRDYSFPFVSEPDFVVLDQYLFSCIHLCLVILMQVSSFVYLTIGFLMICLSMFFASMMRDSGKSKMATYLITAILVVIMIWGNFTYPS
jgi:hypothetical protein